MMPIIAVIAAGFLIFTTSSLAVRISRAWSEAEPTYAERWSGHLAGVLLLVMGIYGIWFLFADSLALVVKSAGV